MDQLEQVEEILKRGYRKAVLGFVKSRVNKSTTYFLELTKGAMVPIVERISLSKLDYILAQDLLDKYDELHKIDKEKEKEKRQKAKEERIKQKEIEIQRALDKEVEIATVIEDEEDEEDEEEEKFEEPPFDEEDPKSELILGSEPMEIIEEDEAEENSGGKLKGDINEPN